MKQFAWWAARSAARPAHPPPAASTCARARASHLRRLKRIKEVFVAYGTVALHRVGHADVVVAQLDRVACAARVAMKEVVAPADAADAAFFAVELLLAQVIIVQVADAAKIGAKARGAIYASGAGRLLGVAGEAHDAAHVVSIHIVLCLLVHLSLTLYRVMTEAAREELPAARRAQLAAACIMLAAAAGNSDGRTVGRAGCAGGIWHR